MNQFVIPIMKGNSIDVMFEHPTETACELGRPLIGRDQVNLCRWFERRKAFNEKEYKRFCVEDVLVLNAYSSHDKDSNDGDDIFAIDDFSEYLKEIGSSKG